MILIWNKGGKPAVRLWTWLKLIRNNFIQLFFLHSEKWDVNSYPPLQISELCLQNNQLEDENGMLSEKNAQNIVEMENLHQQLAELIKEHEMREVFPAKEKNEVNSVSWQAVVVTVVVASS